MGFRVELTPQAEEMYYRCLEYLLYYVGGVGNAQAAQNFVDGYERVLDLLEINAEGCGFLEDEKFRAEGYRKIHFEHMSYKVVFHLERETAIVDAVFHDKQDMRKWLE
ncbi:type II toxin-antitoxin system RelE/ParE family toxin [Candidatus Saccharibacteria bacterium]|nr:type II toxin-antitoxin system RelE/ParE family toxin [Candidatus Saccharibacteria bacterium]